MRALFAVLVLASPVFAKDNPCFDVTPKTMETACSPFIAKLEAAGDRGEELVLGLLFRASWRRQRGDVAGAISDFGRTAAIAETAFPTQRARALERRGHLLLSGGKTAEALADLNEAVALDPKSATALYERGVAKMKLDDPSGGAADTAAALVMNGSVEGSVIDQGGVVGGTPAEMIERCLAQKGWFTNKNIQLGTCGEALKNPPSDPKQHAAVYSGYGSGLAGQRRWDDSLKAYDEAVKLDASNPYPLMNRAEVHADAGHDAAALADFDRALSLSPENYNLFSARGDHNLAKRRFAAAAADFEKAAALEPEEARLWVNLGKSRAGLKQWDAALKAYETAAAKRSDSDGHIGRGAVYLLRGDHRKAIAAYEDAIKEDDGNLFAHAGRAIARRALGDAKGAKADEEAAADRDEDFAAHMYEYWGVPARKP